MWNPFSRLVFIVSVATSVTIGPPVNSSIQAADMFIAGPIGVVRISAPLGPYDPSIQAPLRTSYNSRSRLPADASGVIVTAAVNPGATEKQKKSSSELPEIVRNSLKGTPTIPQFAKVSLASLPSSGGSEER